jgi:membrane protease YdiL (CAAX protease family)
MTKLKRVFWTINERRLRAGWRLTCQMIAMQIVQNSGGIAVFVAATSIGGYSSSESLFTFAQRRPLYMALMVLVTLLSGAGTAFLAVRFLDRRAISDLGFRFRCLYWLDFGFGLFWGAALVSTMFFWERQAGWIMIVDTWRGPEGMPLLLWLAIVFFIASGVAISEEIVFRGYQIRNFAEGFRTRRLGPRSAIVMAWFLTSGLFGLLHIANPGANWISTLTITSAGLLLGLGFVLTGELALSMGLHVGWNFFLGFVYGFPVSGLKPEYGVIAIRQEGPTLWTGGAFGPEAGMVGLAAIVAGMAGILAWIRLVHGRIRIKTPNAD